MRSILVVGEFDEDTSLFCPACKVPCGERFEHGDYTGVNCCSECSKCGTTYFICPTSAHTESDVMQRIWDDADGTTKDDDFGGCTKRATRAEAESRFGDLSPLKKHMWGGGDDLDKCHYYDVSVLRVTALGADPVPTDADYERSDFSESEFEFEDTIHDRTVWTPLNTYGTKQREYFQPYRAVCDTCGAEYEGCTYAD